MKRPLTSIILNLLAIIAVAQAAAAATKPNIIWIFSDDDSYQTIGAYGGRLQKLNMTPNIDRLAVEGMRFDRCYVSNSICGPSRAVSEYERILSQGYSTDYAESNDGIHCAAAPIMSEYEGIVAALWLTGPAKRLPKSRLRELGKHVKATAAQASQHIQQLK
ncbi:MAG: hypothetical protein ACJAR1_000174 [Rubritalea sp.]|jgi:hypothetical protein